MMMSIGKAAREEDKPFNDFFGKRWQERRDARDTWLSRKLERESGG